MPDRTDESLCRCMTVQLKRRASQSSRMIPHTPALSGEDRSRTILPLADGDDLQCAVRQRTLEFERVFRRRREPAVDLLRRAQQHRHGLRVDRRHLGVRVRGQEGVEQVLALDRRGLGAARAGPGSPDAGEGEERPVLARARTRSAAWRGARRTRRSSSPARRSGTPASASRASSRSARLRTLVIGRAPGFATGGKPQRIIASSRSPSRAVRTTGAIWSGKMPGSGGRLPVVSRMARAISRIAAWPLVRQ